MNRMLSIRVKEFSFHFLLKYIAIQWVPGSSMGSVLTTNDLGYSFIWMEDNRSKAYTPEKKLPLVNGSFIRT